MSQKIIYVFSLISLILFQGSFQQKMHQNKNNISSLINLFKNTYHSKYEIKPEKISKLRKLINIDDSSKDSTGGSTIIPAALFELFDSFAYFLYKQELMYLLDQEEIETCFFDGIIDNLYNDHLVNIFIEGSGKALNDFGNEYVCDYNVRRNVSYLTIHFYMATDHYLNDKDEFLGQDFFYIGLCLPRKCMNATRYLLQDIKVLNICQEVGLSNFKLYINDDVVDMSNKLSSFYSWFFWIYNFFIGIKFLVGIWKIIYLNKGYDGFISNKEENGEIQNLQINPKTENEINNENQTYDTDNFIDNKENSFYSQKEVEKPLDPSFYYNKEINENILSEGENLYNPFEDKEKNIPNWLKFLKLLDLFDNVKILSQNSNKYYNSKGIKSLYFIRFFLMLMSVIHQIMYTQIYLPSKYYHSVDFYSNYSFTFVKLCINASVFWITLDAVIFGYKLMSYLKKEIKLSKYNEINYLTFLKFILLILPKFVVFLFAFIFLHLHASKLTFRLCKMNKAFSNYLYYNDTMQQMSYSLRNNNGASDFFKNFIPFRLNYIDFIENITIEKTTDKTENIIINPLTNKTEIKDFTSDVSKYEIPSPFLTNTDLFVNIYFNEFYLIIIILIYTYISYKLNNGIFDFIVLIINTILFILPAFEALNPFKGNISEKNYTLIYVLGQNYSEKYTHYFINFFYFGFLIGVMKFYLDQNLRNTKAKEKNKFIKLNLPFQYCQKIITYIQGIKFYIKRLILLVSIFFLLLISSSFNILEGKSFAYDADIKFVKIQNITKFLFFYEKNLSGIFYFIFLLMYICYPKYTNIMKIAESTTFIIIERISFCFFTSFSYLIYAQFCVFVITMQMTYANLFYNTVGMFFIIFMVSLFNTALVELPIRQLIKYYMNRNLKEKFINNIYSVNYLRTNTLNSEDSNSHYSRK